MSGHSRDHLSCKLPFWQGNLVSSFTNASAKCPYLWATFRKSSVGRLNLFSCSSHRTCRVTLDNDRKRQQTAICPHPGLGWPDCPVAKTGYAGGVKLLREQVDIRPNRPDKYDQIPLL